MDSSRRNMLAMGVTGAVGAMGSGFMLYKVSGGNTYKVKNGDTWQAGVAYSPEAVIENSEVISDISIDDGLVIEYEEDIQMNGNSQDFEVTESGFHMITEGGHDGYVSKKQLAGTEDENGVNQWQVPLGILEGSREYIFRSKGVPNGSGSVTFSELGFLLEEDEGTYQFGDRGWES